MFIAVTKLEGLSHPLIASIYLKRDRRGNTLIVETKCRRHSKLESLMPGISDLVGRVEADIVLIDYVDIRFGNRQPGTKALPFQI